MSPKWNPASLPSLDGRVYFVTGGNTGIGFWTVHHLALHGATVYMTSRSEEKGNAAISTIKADIKETNSNLEPSIHLIVMDLMSLASVVAGANRIRAECTQLHGLVNSAGIMATPFLMSEDGYESQFQTNYLAHWLLTYHLMPLLESTARVASPGTVRIVNVSSIGHNAALKEGISLEDTSLKDHFTFRRYSQSKLANILHANALHAHYHPSSTSSSDITAISIHPGFVDTQLNDKTWGSTLLTQIMLPILRYIGTYITPEQGSFTTLFAVAGVEVTEQKENMSGKYLVPFGQVGKPSKLAQDMDLADRLWKWSEREMREKGFLPDGKANET